ncbi:MAG: hypothetical protein IKX31_06210 [Muribaculaceae bacterium]|nr:hypothetical protein [Muribaculaceae bacterium]
MKRGKRICETLKNIRREIAVANEIDYNPTECNHEGDCAGTCPKCESETRWLERQLRNRQALGKAVTIAGLSVALGAMSSCNFFEQYKKDKTLGLVPDTSYCSPVDSDNHMLEGDVPMNGPHDTIEALMPMDRTTPLSNKGNDDEEEQLMGEVAVDENGNIGDL